MTSGQQNPFLEPFLSTAETVALARPEVQPELAREVLLEAATLLHNGLALEGLDEHDTRAVVTGLSIALGAPDPGAAVRESARIAMTREVDLHDAAAASAAYLVSANILQI